MNLTSFFAVVVIASITACDKRAEGTMSKRGHTKPDGYLHLHSDGGWGIDVDIWILADDHFRIRSYIASNGAMIEDRVGVSSGAFDEIVALAESLDAWTLTTQALKEDIESARAGQGGYFVMDSSHDYLEFRIPGRSLTADFYAADAFSEHYPDAKRVAAFSKLESAIRRAIYKR